MNTRYDTGDVVLIPATIEMVRRIDDGRLLYTIKEYPGTPEKPTYILEETIIGCIKKKECGKN